MVACHLLGASLSILLLVFAHHKAGDFQDYLKARVNGLYYLLFGRKTITILLMVRHGDLFKKEKL